MFIRLQTTRPTVNCADVSSRNVHNSVQHISSDTLSMMYIFFTLGTCIFSETKWTRWPRTISHYFGHLSTHRSLFGRSSCLDEKIGSLYICDFQPSIFLISCKFHKTAQNMAIFSVTSNNIKLRPLPQYIAW